MKRLAWLLGSGALVMWGVAGALGGCGSSDATIADSSADGGEAGSGTSGGTSGMTSGGTSGGTSGNPGTDGSVPDGSSTSDGGNPEGGAGDGGATSTPDKVPCGNGMQCTTPAQVCCVTGTVGSADAGCQAAGSCTGASIKCDEKADCTGADICCGGFGGAGGGSECTTACKMNQVQLCKTNAECTGGTCYANKCPTTTPGTTVTIDACSKIAFCTQ